MTASPTVHSHLIAIPHHSYPAFCTEIVRLQDSLSVWCGPAPSHLLAQERAEDEEMQRALREAGRDSHATFGATAVEWAVAMARPSAISATSLFRSAADVASPMSQRLARKLELPQLFLSLDLPASLVPSGSAPQAPEDSFALLAIEKGIRDACAQVLSEKERPSSEAKQSPE